MNDATPLQKLHRVAGALEQLTRVVREVTLADLEDVCPPRHQAVADRLRAGVDVLQAAVHVMGLVRSPNGGPFGD